jgi:hypothetical protein
MVHHLEETILQSHHDKIIRYSEMLNTELSQAERDFVMMRLAEEKHALQDLLARHARELEGRRGGHQAA